MSPHTRFPVVRILACALVLACCGQAVARPATPAERREQAFAGVLPACNDPAVLNAISTRFADRESAYWDSGLTIAAFDQIAETGFRAAGVDFIPRRFCIGRALFPGGGVRKLAYAIMEDMGWLGVTGFGVEWCVEGLDRNLAYGDSCRAARP